MYSDVVELFKESGTTNSPTLLVSYGGPFAENFFYATENAHDDEKLNVFAPADYLGRAHAPGGGRAAGAARARPAGSWRRSTSSRATPNSSRRCWRGDARVGVGSHGQLQGLGYHWELWAMAAGGASNYGHAALRDDPRGRGNRLRRPARHHREGQVRPTS